MSMKSYSILLAVLVLTICTGNSLFARAEEDPQEQIQQLETRLPKTHGNERFILLVELTELVRDVNDNKKIRNYGEQALALLPATGALESELILRNALIDVYIPALEVESTLRTAKRIKNLASELKDEGSLAEYYYDMGYYYYLHAEYDNALEFYQTAEQLYVSLGENVDLGYVFNGKGDVYKTLLNLNESMQQYMLAIKTFERVDYHSGIANTYLNIGVIYKEMKQYSDEEASYRFAIKNSVKAGNKYLQALGLWNLGLNVLQHKNDPHKALEHFEKALEFYQQIQPETIRFIDIYLAIGSAWEAQNNDELAKSYFNKALLLTKENDDWQGMAHALELISIMHRKQGEYDVAIELLEQAGKIMREKHYLRNLRNHLKEFHKFLAEAGRYHEAYKTLEEYETLNSDRLGEENRQTLTRLQASLKTKERERKIELLEKERSLQQEKLEHQQDTQRIIIAGFIWFLIVLVLLFNWFRLRAQAAAMAQNVEQEKAISNRLREVDKLKDEFLSNTSHELRTPLYGMIGLIDALLNRPAKVDSEASEILSIVLQNGRRLSRLVADILDFSKMRDQNLKLSLMPVELHSLVDVVLTLCKPMITGKNIELVNAITADCPSVLADEARLEQILYNLVGNAIKFTEQGKIEVNAQPQNDELLIKVSDTGIGIARQQQEKIFNFFVQADSSTQREYGGTGLGLAISKQLIELHNGHITVDSEPGEGSTFSFTLQIANTDVRDESIDESYMPSSEPELKEQRDIVLSEEFPEVAADGQDTKNNPATLLIVDDEPVVHQILKLHLDSKNYRFLSADNGHQALDILKSNNVDMVLLDIMMPRMTGYEVCRTIRKTKSREELPVIFLSARDRSRDRVASFNEGGNDYLIKPIDKKELITRVNTQLDILNVYRGKMEEIQQLRDILPICSWCKKIRDDDGFWSQLEVYFHRNAEVQFSHGICPDCLKDKKSKIKKY